MSINRLYYIVILFLHLIILTIPLIQLVLVCGLVIVLFDSYKKKSSGQIGRLKRSPTFMDSFHEIE